MSRAALWCALAAVVGAGRLGVPVKGCAAFAALALVSGAVFAVYVVASLAGTVL